LLTSWGGSSSKARGHRVGWICPGFRRGSISLSCGILIIMSLGSFSLYADAGTIELNWIATGDDYWEGTAWEYDIRISEHPFRDDMTWEVARCLLGEPRPDTSGTPQHWEIGGLVPGRTYWVGLKVYDEVRNASPLKIWEAIAQPINPPRDLRWR
jgi:hypothetical protein